MPSYTTIKGDTFDSVSRKTTGTEAAAGEIRAANPGVIEPMAAGLILTVPKKIDLVPGPPVTVPSNELSLSLDGSRFRFWDSITFNRNFDTLDTISFKAPFEIDNTDFRSLFAPLAYKSAEIFIGNDRLFNGTILPVDPSFSSEQGAVTVGAISRPGVLEDCTAPASALPLEFKNVDLRTIVPAVVAPFGLSVTFLSDIGGPFRRVRIDPFEKLFPQIAELAVQRNLYISSDANGTLVFKTADGDANPIASLDGGQSPITNVVPEIDPQQYYSEITGFRGSKSGRTGSSYTIKNPLLPGVVRPFNFRAEDIKRSELAAAVTGKLARMLGNFVKYSVELSTWRDPQGEIWEPGTFIDLKAERAMIYENYRFFIRSVSLKRTKNTESASMGITLPGAYSGELPEALPWAA